MQFPIQNTFSFVIRLVLGLALCGSATAGGPALVSKALPLPDDAATTDEPSFSYTYFQATYAGISTSADVDSDRIAGRLSVGIGRSFYVGGEYSLVEAKDSDASVDATSVSFGMHTDLNEDIDMFGEVGYRLQTNDLSGVSFDSDGPLIGFGFRGVSPNRSFEAEARYTHNWLAPDTGSDMDFGNFRFELLWRATDNLALVVGGDWQKNDASDTVKAFALGLRLTL